MKFENTSVMNIENALRGMRNPMNSWDKSDSYNCNKYKNMDCDNCNHNKNKRCLLFNNILDIPYYIGENDLKLAQKLILAGNEHRKFMRQIFVSVDITAPLYFWKEFEQYKVGTTTNSTSTMHKLTSQPITLDCFEIDDFDGNVGCGGTKEYPLCVGVEFGETFINILENLRIGYIVTNDKKYWKELIRLLPSSWLQMRTVTMNYENIRSMYHQRKNHKLNEWSGLDNPENENFCKWVKSLPYAEELILLDNK